MSKHRTKDSEPGAISGVDTDPAADRRRVVHRAVAMVPIVGARAFDRRDLRTGNEERRHHDQRCRLDDEPDRGGRPGEAADARHQVSVHERVCRPAGVAHDI